MQGSLYVLINGGTWLKTTDYDYEQKALRDMLYNVCGSPLIGTYPEETARIALSDNRLYPSQKVIDQFEHFMGCMVLPTAMKLFRPGNVPTTAGGDPEYHTVMAETLEINSTATFQDFFSWLISFPGANAVLVQAYQNLLQLLHRQEELYLPHFRKALAKNPYAPDFAFVMGLAAAGVKLDEQHWLGTYGYFQPGQEPWNIE